MAKSRGTLHFVKPTTFFTFAMVSFVDFFFIFLLTANSGQES